MSAQASGGVDTGRALVSSLDEYTETKTVWVELSGRTRDPFTVG